MDSTVELKLLMYGVVNNAVCLFGLCGNFLLLYIFILYKDMRKQSINIYLTVLALYDNGVLIFSILMLNLPAITDYQQMLLAGSMELTLNQSSTIHPIHHTTTPLFTSSFPVTSQSNHYYTTSSMFTVSGSTTRIPLDTGQMNRTWNNRTSSQGLQGVVSTSTTFGTLVTSTAMPITVNTSMPSLSHSSSSSSSSSPPGVTISLPSPAHLRHQSTTSTAPNHHRAKRRVSPHLFTPQIGDIFQSCFNLTNDDLTQLKQNMVLLNTSVNFESKVDQSLVDRLFFEALLRQLIVWIRVSLNVKLSPVKPTTEPSGPSGPVPDPKQYLNAITDLVRCRHSLLQYYRQEVPQNDQSSSNDQPAATISDQQSEVRMPELSERFESNQHESSSQGFDPSEDEATSVNLLLLNTLEDIYRSRTFGDSPGYPQTLYYADSLTGEGNHVDFNQSSTAPVNETDELEPEFLPPPPPGSLIPLIYYVKIVYPLALISQTGSIWTTCLITIERYLAVCHPLMSLTLSTRSRAIWALCILSVAALMFNLPRFAEVDTTGDSIRPSDLRRNNIYYHVYYICLNLSLNYILPLSLLSALNIKIYASVRHANAHRNELTRARQSELHLASMLVLIVAIFIACNAPAFLVNCMEPYFDVGNPLFEAITIFSNVLVCFNSAINFVIYCIFGKKFRSKLKQVFGLDGFSCFVRSGSGRHLRSRNRYFSRHFSNVSTRASSFKVTMATHVGGANHGPNGAHHAQRQYSYPHTPLPTVVADSLVPHPLNGSSDKLKNGSDECGTKLNSAGLNLIPLDTLTSNGTATTGNHFKETSPNHFYETNNNPRLTVNTFV